MAISNTNPKASNEMRQKLAEIVGMWARARILPRAVINEINVGLVGWLVGWESLKVELH